MVDSCTSLKLIVLYANLSNELVYIISNYKIDLMNFNAKKKTKT